MIVVWLFFAVPWVSLQFVIVVFSDHTHLLFIFLYTGELNEFNSFIDKLNFDKMPNMINFCVNIRQKSILSIRPSKNCCIIKSISSIMEFISLNSQITK